MNFFILANTIELSSTTSDSTENEERHEREILDEIKRKFGKGVQFTSKLYKTKPKITKSDFHKIMVDNKVANELHFQHLLEVNKKFQKSCVLMGNMVEGAKRQ